MLRPTIHPRAGAGAGVALALVAVTACGPDVTNPEDMVESAVRDPVVAMDGELKICSIPLPDDSSDRRPDLAEAPAFTPREVDPRLINPAEVQEAREALFPARHQVEGAASTVSTWIFVDTIGTVQNALVRDSSGNPAADRAAVKVARTMEFEPALNRDIPVPVWLQLEIPFPEN